VSYAEKMILRNTGNIYRYAAAKKKEEINKTQKKEPKNGKN
jgi:hypothetical protein